MSLICNNSSELCETAVMIVNANHDFQLKTFVLFFLAAFFIWLKWNSKNIDKNKSQFNLMFWIMSYYMSVVYIATIPFTFLFLRLDFELFVWFLAGIYLLMFPLFFIMLSLFAKDKVLSFISQESRDKRAERRAYGKN